MDTFTLRDLTFFYPEQETPALNGVQLCVHPGDFLVLCGPSGCGKSTLLRQLKPTLSPHGRRTGHLLFEGRPPEELDLREQASRIGFVLQSPDNQTVTDKVWHELAFGLESLGFDTPTIRRRVAEMASFFGIQTWFYKDVTELSGGQRQLLNLASVMVMQPSVLILDEPTGQLDPIAAADFLATLGKINRELGTTVILTEHRLEDAFPQATRVAVMEQGRILCDGTPRTVGAALRRQNHSMFLAMPTPMRIWAAVPQTAECPVTVRDGREWLTAYAGSHTLQPLPPAPEFRFGDEAAITAEELWFRYEKDLPDVVRSLSFTVKRGEFLALLGGNGTGKTTSLKLLGGLLQPQRGQVRRVGTVGMLPQDPQTLFVKKTLREDLLEVFRGTDADDGLRMDRLARAVTLCRLGDLLDRHPYDLSGGEQQRAALAKVLLLEPDILLMDEPTKGLDAEFKDIFAGILRQLLAQGVTLLMVSHDIEFCARHAHRCALFFDGSIVAQGPPRTFFSGNSFYTTAANRMARDLLPDAVTAEDVILACGGTAAPPAEPPEEACPLPPVSGGGAGRKPNPLPLWRRLLALLAGAGVLILVLQALRITDLTALVDAGGLTVLSADQLKLYALLVLALVLLALAVGRRSARPVSVTPAPQRRRLSRRTLAASGIILLLIPLTLFLGIRVLDGRKYYFISLLVLLECMLPFFLIFEGRKPQARELVLIAVLCALGVAGRAVFFMLPEFKPVIALTIIAGAALGGETGFLVGAVTMLASNVLFSQGPWTPWQMFALGIIGFLSGVLFRKGLLRRSRLMLSIYGALVSVVIYGGIMNPAAALIWAHTLNRELLLAYFLTGLPVDLVRAAATALFLWFAAEPMLEKLDRIKVKYGLVE